MKKYKAFDNSGYEIATGTAAEVAHAMMTKDGQHYEIRKFARVRRNVVYFSFNLFAQTYQGGPILQWGDYFGKTEDEVIEKILTLGGNNDTRAEEV